jgi:hypothetical protein
MQNRVDRHTTVLPDSDFFRIVLNTPLRVRGHAHLAAASLYERLLALVVDREVCDKLSVSRFASASCSSSGTKTRKFDFSE